MAYTMIKLTREPIWLLQEDETPTQCYFLDLYIHSGMTFPEFIKSFQIKKENGEIHNLQKGDIWESKGGENKQKFELLFNPPNSQRTFRNWYYYRKWDERCRAYWDNFTQKRQQSFQKTVLEFCERDIINLIESADTDWDIDKEINDDCLTKPHLKAKGKNDVASSHQKKIESIFVESGMPKDISKFKSDMNVNSSVTIFDKSNELFTDELEDYNIDDTFDEVTEDVDN